MQGLLWVGLDDLCSLPSLRQDLFKDPGGRREKIEMLWLTIMDCFVPQVWNALCCCCMAEVFCFVFCLGKGGGRVLPLHNFSFLGEVLWRRRTKAVRAQHGHPSPIWGSSRSVSKSFLRKCLSSEFRVSAKPGPLFWKPCVSSVHSSPSQV